MELHNNTTETTRAAGNTTRPLLLVTGLVVGSFVAGVMGGIAGAVIVTQDHSLVRSGSGSSALVSDKQDGNTATTVDEEQIAKVAKDVAPSVVSILSSHAAKSLMYGTYEEDGAGTGVIISKDGYILTNNHVVDGADSVTVELSDGTSYKAVRVVGRDPSNDIAYLKINNVTNLPAAHLGDSKTLHIGQRVVAIGNTLGQYQNTVTSGIVSGLGRIAAVGEAGSYTPSEELHDLIQTDAAINPGNSGGPLVNLAGQIIGINTAVAYDADNVGFVIPITAVKGTIKTLLTTGSVRRSYIGVQYLTITPAVAAQYGLNVKSGAYLYTTRGSAIVRGGPADVAGLKSKDIIAKVQGTPVGAAGEVSTLVGEYAAGETIALTVLRDGKELNISVTLGIYH